jgi:hypothetical protein
VKVNWSVLISESVIVGGGITSIMQRQSTCITIIVQFTYVESLCIIIIIGMHACFT